MIRQSLRELRSEFSRRPMATVKLALCSLLVSCCLLMTMSLALSTAAETVSQICSYSARLAMP